MSEPKRDNLPEGVHDDVPPSPIDAKQYIIDRQAGEILAQDETERKEMEEDQSVAKEVELAKQIYVASHREAVGGNQNIV